MRRFLLKSALFLAPVALYMAVVSLADPYTLYKPPVTFRQSLKDSVAAGVNNALFKFARYDRERAPNIILGDSRMYALDTALLREVSGEGYYNFSIFGASFNEITSAFWFAAERAELKNVYMGLNFLLYNRKGQRDRTTSANSIIENNLLYYCAWDVLKPSFHMIWTLGANQPDPGRPLSVRDRFWQQVLFEDVVPGYLNRYVFPEEFGRELIRIAEYCRGKGINLRFVIPPTHADLQKRVADYRLLAEEARFKAQLRAIAPTYDFEFANPLTAERENFKDPMHYTAPVGRMMVQTIWGGKLSAADTLVRYSEPALAGPATAEVPSRVPSAEPVPSPAH